MTFLQSLFNETSDHGVAKKHLKRISRSCHDLKGFEDLIPDMRYPLQGTAKFDEDISEVRRCIKNPSLNSGFLKMTDNSVESIYEKYLKDNNLEFDWQCADRLVEDLDTIILRLKYGHARPRPKECFELNGENIKVVDASSPSFPSGHTAIAYLLSSVISEAFPSHRMPLQTLAEMIAQSRLENGAHFPTDITAGRFLGESAHSYYLEKTKTQMSKKGDQENLTRLLRSSALESRKDLSKERAMQLYAADFANFLSSVTGASESDCLSCSLDFLSGLPANLCTENLSVKLVLDFLSAGVNISKTDCLGSIDLNKLLQQTQKTQIRDFSRQSKLGFACPEPDKILDMTRKCFEMDSRPYIKFLLLNYIKPFNSCNKKFAKLTLARDLDYNFDIVNQLLDRDIDEQVKELCSQYDAETMLMP